MEDLISVNSKAYYLNKLYRVSEIYPDGNIELIFHEVGSIDFEIKNGFSYDRDLDSLVKIVSSSEMELDLSDARSILTEKNKH